MPAIQDTEASDITFAFGPEGAQVYEEQYATHLRGLSRPPDDMWASFADAAEKASIIAAEQPIGCVSLDSAGELLRLHLEPGFEFLASATVDRLRQLRSVAAIVCSTADALALSTALAQASSIECVALLYEWTPMSQIDGLDAIRPGSAADLDAVARFAAAATASSPSEQERRYLAERIDRAELFLFEVDGALRAIGERRIDVRSPECAHLGVIVDAGHRGAGLGRAVFASMLELAVREGRIPLCSTEPGNHAAQHLIRRCGFTSRHSVVRIHLPPG